MESAIQTHSFGSLKSASCLFKRDIGRSKDGGWYMIDCCMMAAGVKLDHEPYDRSSPQ